jgi:hypothetical protein
MEKISRHRIIKRQIAACANVMIGTVGHGNLGPEPSWAHQAAGHLVQR